MKRGRSVAVPSSSCSAWHCSTWAVQAGQQREQKVPRSSALASLSSLLPTMLQAACWSQRAQIADPANANIPISHLRSCSQSRVTLQHTSRQGPSLRDPLLQDTLLQDPLLQGPPLHPTSPAPRWLPALLAGQTIGERRQQSSSSSAAASPFFTQCPTCHPPATSQVLPRQKAALKWRYFVFQILLKNKHKKNHCPVMPVIWPPLVTAHTMLCS